ncbi:hypothetical protein ACQ3G6_17840, partial [Allorhizobium undicola]|uniref:hypothetical protein n=1 Tax=Allorhizobium undicola TaxID=78527 RepID=UPI003D32CBF7
VAVATSNFLDAFIVSGRQTGVVRMDVVGDLKRKMGEIGSEIEELRSRITVPEEQKSAFAVVIRAYDPDFSPEASITPARKRPQARTVPARQPSHSC